MPKKELGPLQTAQKEGDALKKKIEQALKDGDKIIKDTKAKDKEVKLKEQYEKCVDIEKEADALTKKLESLKEEEEPTKVKDFDGKRNAEITRIQKLQDKLKVQIENLEPEEVKKAREEREKAAEEDEEEYDEDDDEEYEDEEIEEEEYDDEELEEEEEEFEEEEDGEDEEEEEEEDDEDEGEDAGGPRVLSQAPVIRQYEGVVNFQGEQEGDLSFKAGDVLTIISAREDGWLEAENERGEKGMVPITFLKPYNKYKELQAEEEEDEEDDDEDVSPRTPRSGRVLWKNIRDAVKETSATDVLHALGAVPSGFRPSTLAKMMSQEQYTMKNYLMPKLSQSCVSYKDLFFNPTTNQVRSRNVRFQRIISLTACRQIPSPGQGVEVRSRYVNICLFDGKNVLSNIHKVKVSTVDKEQKTWNFNTKATDNMKTAEFGEFFVRCNNTEGNIGILFELCISYVRQNTDQEGEFSCGWVHLPLMDTNNAPVQNKNHDLYVNGGTPYEKGVEVDPQISRRASASKFKTMISGNKQPRLAVKLMQPTKEQKDFLDTLPDVMVSSTAYIQYLSFYRQLLADALFRDRIDMQSTELIHHPLLTSFPTIVDQPDIMDVLRVAWSEKLKVTKRADKHRRMSQNLRDHETQKENFCKVYMDHIYPLAYVTSLPPHQMGNVASEQERLKQITNLQNIHRDKKAQMAALLTSPDITYAPFDISELSFNVTGPFCTVRA